MKHWRVLLVDDETMVREHLRKSFDWAGHGCEVVGEAADGMEALNRIEMLVPDIVVMEINLPVLNGLKVIERCQMVYEGISFIVVTKQENFTSCREAFRMRIADYILKPLNYEEFGSSIDQLRTSQFEKEVRKGGMQPQRPIVEIIRYLQEHLETGISLKLLAEQFHLSAQYISQLFKTEMGVNFLTYLTGIRMEEAKKLLLSSTLAISEIAEQCGYGDYRTFSKAFKKMVGITPSAYRKLTREEQIWRKEMEY